MKTIISAVFSVVILSSLSFAMTPAEIENNIAPVGEVSVAGAAAPTTTTAAANAPSGEAIYKQYCFACHQTGAAGAPLFGNKAAWEKRIAQGQSVLLQHALNGFNAMPPRGTCATCTEADLKAAIEYMVSQAK